MASVLLQQQAGSQLEELIQELQTSGDPQCESLFEHLWSARTYLLGAMPLEYEMSLQMALSAAQHANEPFRSALLSTLRDLHAKAWHWYHHGGIEREVSRKNRSHRDSEVLKESLL